MRRQLVWVLLAVLLVGAMVGTRSETVMAQLEVLDQSSTGIEGCVNNDLRQTFTAGITGSLTRVELDVDSVLGYPTASSVEIRSVDGSGAPTNTVLATGSIPSGASGWTSVALTPNLAVSAGTRYAIVALSQTSDSIALYCNITNPYAGGTIFYGSNHVSTIDLNFAPM